LSDTPAYSDVERQRITYAHLVWPFFTQPYFGEDPFIDSNGSACLLSLVMLIESIRKVEISVQIHVLPSNERSPAKGESETHASGGSDLKVRIRTSLSFESLTIP
jgi:hypothetical protein